MSATTISSVSALTCRQGSKSVRHPSRQSANPLLHPPGPRRVVIRRVRAFHKSNNSITAYFRGDMEVDNSTHAATTCHSGGGEDPRRRLWPPKPAGLGAGFCPLPVLEAYFVVNLGKFGEGLAPGACSVCEAKQTTTRWLRLALPHCAAFVLHLQEFPKI